MRLAHPRLLALAALTGGVVLAGCPAPGGVTGSPSPEATKKVTPKATKKPGSPSPKPTDGATSKPTAGPTGSPSPTPTPTPTATPTSSAIATPTPTPTATPTPTPTPAAADQAAITAATAFPFTAVGQTWTYDTKLTTSLASLTGSRVISVKALTATTATIHVKDTTDTSKLPIGGGSTPKVQETDVDVPLSAPDPYYAIEAGIAKLAATVTPGASTFTAATEKVAGVDTAVIVRAYDVPAPANLKITNSLAAGKGLVGSTLKGTELPADLVPAPFNKTAYTVTQTFKSFSATAP